MVNQGIRLRIPESFSITPGRSSLSFTFSILWPSPDNLLSSTSSNPTERFNLPSVTWICSRVLPRMDTPSSPHYRTINTIACHGLPLLRWLCLQHVHLGLGIGSDRLKLFFFWMFDPEILTNTRPIQKPLPAMEMAVFISYVRSSSLGRACVEQLVTSNGDFCF